MHAKVVLYHITADVKFIAENFHMNIDLIDQRNHYVTPQKSLYN